MLAPRAGGGVSDARRPPLRLRFGVAHGCEPSSMETPPARRNRAAESYTERRPQRAHSVLRCQGSPGRRSLGRAPKPLSSPSGYSASIRAEARSTPAHVCALRHQLAAPLTVGHPVHAAAAVQVPVGASILRCLSPHGGTDRNTRVSVIDSFGEAKTTPQRSPSAKRLSPEGPKRSGGPRVARLTVAPSEVVPRAQLGAPSYTRPTVPAQLCLGEQPSPGRPYVFGASCAPAWLADSHDAPVRVLDQFSGHSLDGVEIVSAKRTHRPVRASSRPGYTAENHLAHGHHGTALVQLPRSGV
jgi:hypothetical protein